MDSISTLARLAALDLTLPRFRGRTQLLRRAATFATYSAPHDAPAIAILDALDVVARDGVRALEIQTLRGQVAADLVKECGFLRTRDRIRAERAAARDKGVDQLADRTPGNAVRRAVTKAVRAAIREADLRTARHSHDTTIEIVEPGSEGATSISDQARPSSVGLSNAYAKKGFWVATSEHTFRVSRDFLATPCESRAETGVLYLSPTCRVRQGRGTSLVVERLGANARGTLVWS